MTIAGSPIDRDSRPLAAAPFPRPVALCLAGLASIIVVVVMAIVVRPVPFADLDGSGAGELGTAAMASPGAAGSDDDEDRPTAGNAAPSGTSRELRTRLAQQVRGGKLKDATDTFEALIAADPRSAEDVDVRSDIMELASKVEFAGGREADRVYDALGSKMGSLGPDVLYAIVTGKGGSKAATRAEKLLEREDVRQRATAATRIAFDLWNAKSCPDKAALLDRARDDGDGRTLGWLQVMGRGCRMSKDAKLVEAVTAIKGRMR